MFISNTMLLPGQELREFTVSRPVTGGAGVGRTTGGAGGGRAGAIGGYSRAGEIIGILAQAKPGEAERWRQLGHPVSHEIVMKGRPAFGILPGDVFELGGRRFHNQMVPTDPGGLGHWTIFYCDERADI